MSLNIEIPDHSPSGVRETLGEDSIVSFESGLSARTKVPAERLGDFLGWNESRVRREARVV